MRKRTVIAIDVGGTKTLCALISEKYETLLEKKFRTAPEDGRKKFIKRLIEALEALATISKKEKHRLVGAGVAWAGHVDEASCQTKASPNILCLEDLNIGQLLKKTLRVKTTVGNDVQLALYGEHQLGVARECSHVLGVFFGTGVAGAAIIDGNLYRGASGMGGQIGSILTHHIGGSATLESHGILDRIASKAAIAGAALGIASKQWAPHLFEEVGTDLAKVTWGALRRSIRNGDKPIDELLRARLRVAGIALSSVVNFLNPQMIVLGGGLTEEMPRLVLTEVARGLREYLVPEVSKAVKVKVAKHKNNAGVIGAARCAFEAFG